jgi:crotonobetainyl-CoA:carnitine CoA-transferase CaiB-like acyl-CoA transferase
VLVENFATGVMDRLGLGADALQAAAPNLIYVSASGLGRTGPEAHAVAYGTLLQCYAGFAGLNRHPGLPPRVGMAWLDPMCGLMLAFITAAAIWRRRRLGGAARVDFSMIEALLWTMAEPQLAAQLGQAPAPTGDVYQCLGDDDWIGVGAGDAAGYRDLTDWASDQSVAQAASILRDAGIPAAALARSSDLVESTHLRMRAFWDQHGTRVVPGLPWQASCGRATGDAPALGADTNNVLVEVLGLSVDEVQRLRQTGALG